MLYLGARDFDSQSLLNSQWDFKCLSTRYATVATPIFLSKTAFSYRFRIVFESYRFMPFQLPFEEKKRCLNGVFSFSQSQGIDKNAVYRFKRSSLSFILLTIQQPFQAKRFNG